jgi:hypothetical protein
VKECLLACARSLLGSSPAPQQQTNKHKKGEEKYVSLAHVAYFPSLNQCNWLEILNQGLWFDLIRKESFAKSKPLKKRKETIQKNNFTVFKSYWNLGCRCS